MTEKTTKPKISLGLNYVSLAILAVLVILLGLEFSLAQFTVPRWGLLIFGAIQTGIILWEYMHVRRLWGNSKKQPNKNKPD
jgi:hypothetical protein